MQIVFFHWFMENNFLWFQASGNPVKFRSGSATVNPNIDHCGRESSIHVTVRCNSDGKTDGVGKARRPAWFTPWNIRGNTCCATDAVKHPLRVFPITWFFKCGKRIRVCVSAVIAFLFADGNSSDCNTRAHSFYRAGLTPWMKTTAGSSLCLDIPHYSTCGNEQ